MVQSNKTLAQNSGPNQRAAAVCIFFKNAILWPGFKEQITLRVDPDVLKFFRKQGRGYQTTINAVLRKYMEAQSADVKHRPSGVARKRAVAKAQA